MDRTARRIAGAAVAAAGLLWAWPGTAQSFEDCRDGRADRAACEARYMAGFQVICFNDGKKVYEGDAWLVRSRDEEPLPYLQENGREVAPLWERYGACKIIHPGAGGP